MVVTFPCSVFILPVPVYQQHLSQHNELLSRLHLCGVMFLLSSDMRKRDLVIFMIILLPGLVSFRSKFVAEIIIYAALLFYVKRPMKLSLKLLVLMAILAVVVIWANFESLASTLSQDMMRERLVHICITPLSRCWATIFHSVPVSEHLEQTHRDVITPLYIISMALISFMDAGPMIIKQTIRSLWIRSSLSS